MGSKSALTAPKFNVRYTLKSRRNPDIAEGPVRANSGIMHRSEKQLFDHVVGAIEQKIVPPT
jgi:hypothetical protein